MSAADNIIGLYRRHASPWTKARGNVLYEKEWIDRFCSLLPQASHVLDIGCGPGEPIAGALADRGFAVTGVDSSPEMLTLFQANVPGQATHIADMRELSLPKIFNGLLAWDSFFHLSPEDQRQMFPIFRRHAAPRAVLMFTSGPSHGEALGMLEGETLYHASLDAAEYRDLLNQNGFDVVAHVVEDPSCGKHTVWLAQLR